MRKNEKSWQDVCMELKAGTRRETSCADKICGNCKRLWEVVWVKRFRNGVAYLALSKSIKAQRTDSSAELIVADACEFRGRLS